MSWTHAICEKCWKQEKGGQIPHRIREAAEEPCCFCGAPTSAGIYLRHDPKLLECKHNQPAGAD